MSDLTLFEVDAPTPLAVVPACMYCGAQGSPIEEDPTVGGFNGAVSFAYVAIKRHMAEMHPEKTA